MYVVLLTISYTCYVFPLVYIFTYLMAQRVLMVHQGIASILISVIIMYYLRSKSTNPFIRRFVYDGLGIGFFSLNAILIAVAVNQLFNIGHDYEVGLSVVLMMLGSGYAHFNTKRIHVRQILYRTKKIVQAQTVVFVSDLHFGTNSASHLKKIINEIKEQAPDVVLIGGDLVDSSSCDLSGLAVFKSINVPIYFVTGNHEYYLRNSESVIQSLKNYNITVIDNMKVTYGGIEIIGLSDNQTIKEKRARLAQLLDPNALSITMVHRPSLWANIRQKPNIMLCGHTHNGQIFPFNFLVKLQFKYIYGSYLNNNQLLYVSSGAATWGPKMRLGSRNEIVTLRIEQ